MWGAASQAPRDDSAAASAAAGALAAILAANQQRWAANSAAPAPRTPGAGVAPQRASPSPPPQLFSAAAMAALRVRTEGDTHKLPASGAFERVVALLLHPCIQP